MALDVQQRGVASQRFMFGTLGTNTYTQAQEIFNMLRFKKDKNLLIVTSPEHMYRCIRTFEKCGFANVSGLPAFEGYLDEDILLTKEEKEKRFQSPDRIVGLRYNIWTNLKIEITLVREGVAIVWYEIRGYI